MHSSARGGLRRGVAEVPGSIGRKLLKRGFRWTFKNSHGLFLRGTDRVRGEAECPAGHVWWGCGVFGRLHRAEHYRGSVFPYRNRSRHGEKSLFIEIDSQGGEGGRFKKSDISYTALIMGLEVPVLLGFRYYKGR